MDVDQDGRVNYKEFILACSTYTTKINEKQIKELFDQIDVNNDGYIDMGEMKNFFQDEQYGESGASTTPEAQIWEQIMDELDKDGTKRVNYKNFHSSMVSVI